MKRVVAVSLLAASIVTLWVLPGAAWHRGHGGVFIELGLPVWVPPPRYYVVPPPPTLAIQQPVVYVQRPPVPQSPPSPPTQTSSYWYFCPTARAYYPYVQSCPEPWLPVPTRPLQ